jgi:putative aldouronate transport system permease protein
VETVKRSLGEKIFDTGNVLFLGIIGLVTLFPFWNVLATSFVGASEYYSRPFILWPHKFNPSAYLYLFSTNWIGNGFKISILVTVLGTFYDMFLICTAAYALATRRSFPGKKFFTFYFLLTMYFGGGIIPYYLVVSKYLHLYNHIAAMIITSGLSVWSFMVLRTFFRDIPESLSESAKMDGANEFLILCKIILPLSLPAIATLTLFSAVGHWNEWGRALYFINDDYKQPLQMILRKMVLDPNSTVTMREVMNKAYQNLVGGTDETIFDVAVKSATIAVVTIPILCVYPFLQKYFSKGVMIGSVKE